MWESSDADQLPYELLRAAGCNEFEIARLERLRFLIAANLVDDLTMEYKRLEFARYYYFMRSRVVWE